MKGAPMDHPRILVFACRWCGLIGADAAGKKKISLPVPFRVIPVECAAFVETDAIIRALAQGVDGVAVLGCHIGGCRFNNANYTAIKRMNLLRDLLDSTGIGRNRLVFGFGTAHENHQFEEILRSFFDELAVLPPLDPGLLPFGVTI
jgi:F420-non-reducing hydrogenase iron-sulfur subunit